MILIITGIIIFLCVYFLCITVWDMTHFVVRSYCVSSPKIRKRLRAVLISDLHNHSYGRDNERLAEAVHLLGPDVILVAGDLFNSRPNAGMKHATALLKKISDCAPVYYAYGNHEDKVRRCTELFGDVFEAFRAGIEGCDIHFLDNGRRYLQEYNVELAGINIGPRFFRHFHREKMEEGCPGSLLGPADADRFELLIAHNPLYFHEYRSWGADLTVSGHLHGGMVRLPILEGVASPDVSFFPKYDGGYFCEEGSHLIVSRGLGTHTLPLRVWNPGELVEIVLEPESEQDAHSRE